MAIQARKKKGEGDERTKEIKVVLTNGHIDAIENIVKKYQNINNEAQALDFIIKSIGYNKDPAEGVTVGGVTFTPDTYE